MKVIDSIEHGEIVKDIPPREKNVNQGLTRKPLSICLTPNGYAK